MAKKLLALTMVLVLAAGVAAFADLSGSWTNEFTLVPDPVNSTAANEFAAFDSVLTVNYSFGGVDLSSTSTFYLGGYADQEFGAAFTVGLLDLESTVDMYPSGQMIDYWKNKASMTVGAVDISGTLWLQRFDWNTRSYSSYVPPWPESSAVTAVPTFVSTLDPANSVIEVSQTDSTGLDEYGTGMELVFSGETPGGVSVTLTNLLGMKPEADAETALTNKVQTLVQNEIMSSSGDSAFTGVSGQEAIDWLVTLTGTSEDNVKAWLASQLGVGDVDLDGDVSVSGKADDFEAYVAEMYPSSTYATAIGDPTTSISDTVRDTIVSAIVTPVAIDGIPAETGYIMNTRFNLDGVSFTWTGGSGSGTSYTAPSLVVDEVDIYPAENAAAFKYYSTKLELTGLGMGCCTFDNTTVFTIVDGLKYTQFDFTIGEEANLPISLTGQIKWNFGQYATTTGKAATLTPTIATDWACFDIYAALTTSGSTITGLDFQGFGISGVEVGHVTLSALTALGSNTVYTLDSSFHAYDEVLRLQKLDKYPLDFTVDIYTNMSGGLVPVAVDGSASYPISDQFTLGSGLAVTQSGLQEVKLSFDYTF